MKWLSAGLSFVNCATLCGLFLGMMAGGLGSWVALASLSLGLAAALAAYLTTADPRNSKNPVAHEQVSGRDARRLKKSGQLSAAGAKSHYSLWLWAVAACFAIFAVRSFCWLLFQDGEDLKIQSPNNLGDLALHITHIENFAKSAQIWPDNPIYSFSKLQYPAGTDLFNALLVCMHVDLARGLIWAGLFASLATFYAFYRWGGTFGVAGFLFNGGVAGFEFFRRHEWIDYQSTGITWKSIPLAMFVTQRGVLYAIPAGLLLLWHWRERFYRTSAEDRHRLRGLSFWIELSLYASMPLFHLHTFMALSLVLFFLFAFGDTAIRKHTAKLVGGALLPATFFVWLVTNHFHAQSVLAFKPFLLEKAEDLAQPYFLFWPINLGLWLPLAIVLFGICVWQVRDRRLNWNEKLPENLSFLLPAAVIFVLCDFVKLAPWEWDNLKVMVWAYFIILPFLWTDLIAKWTLPVRAVVCLLLFASGFVSLFGGLAPDPHGYVFANRGELYSVALGVRKVPIEARFAAFPTYNHPLLLDGRKVALGYPGHVWTQGFDYETPNAKLRELMQGDGDWRKTARDLRVRYLFWGREEKINYPTSKRPWERTAKLVNSGNWGAVYDLESDNWTKSDP